MLAISKNATVIYRTKDRDFRVVMTRKKSFRSVLITEIKKEVVGSDKEFIDWQSNSEPATKIKIEDILTDFNNLDFEEESDLDFDLESNFEEHTSDNTSTEDLLEFDLSDEDYEMLIEEDNKDHALESDENEDKYNIIKNLIGTEELDKFLKIYSGQFIEEVNKVSANQIQMENLNLDSKLANSDVDVNKDLEKSDTSMDSLLSWDNSDNKSTKNAIKNSILNDEIETGIKFVDENKDIRTEYTFNDEKVVYHWVYVEEKVENFEENQHLFYDLNINDYSYGETATAIKLITKINDIIKKQLPNSDEVETELINKMLNGYQVLANSSTYSGEDYYLNIYTNLRGRELFKKYIDDEINVEITLANHPFDIYSKLIEDLPYTKKQSFTFSRDFRNKIKSDDSYQLRFPDISVFKSSLNIDYVEESDYRIIDDEEGLIWLKNEIDKLHPDHVIAYDAETTGLMFRRWLKEEERDKLVTHSFSWKDKQAVIIPVGMKNRKNITKEQEQKYIKPILEQRSILAHNGSADVLFNMYSNIEVNLVEDTIILAKHIMPYLKVDEKTGKSKSRSRVQVNLGYLLNRTFGRDKINLKKSVFDPQGATFDFSVLPDDYLIYYGCPDTDQLRQLWKVFRAKLRPEQEIAYRAMVRFSKMMAEKSTFQGIKLSEEIIIENRNKTAELLDLLKAMALKVADETEETLSITSSKQLANFIYGKMGVPVTERTKRTADGDLSADKYVLSGLANEKREIPSSMFKKDIYDIDGSVLIKAEDLNRAKYPFAVLVRAYADNYKNLTAYYDGLIKASYDNIYYPEPRIGSTATWRTTERTQITKGNIKYGLGVYDPNEYYFCTMDFSAEELRLAVNQSNDDGYKKILANPENDPHRATAARLFGIPEYEVTHQLRAKAKTANFGIIYGMSGTRLAKQMAGTEYINQQQLKDGLEVYNGYKYLYREMLKPLNEASHQVQEHGWLFNKLGFMMIYDDVLDLEDYESQVFDINKKEPPVIRLDEARKAEYAGSLKNKAGNYPVQSWAAGLLMVLSLKFEKKLKEYGIYDKIAIPMTVHDELDIIIHKSVHPLLIMKLLKECYETTLGGLGTFTVPLFIGIGFGMSWGVAKSDDAEIPVNLQNILVKEYDEGLVGDIPVQEIPDWFTHRKTEYLRGRLKDVLQEELDTKVFHYASVRKKLRSEIFVLNQCADMFKIYNSKSGEYFYDTILETICVGEDMEPKDFTVDTDDVIIDEKEDEPVDFFFNALIHPRLEIFGDTAILDVNGLTNSVITNLLNFLIRYKLDKEMEDDKDAKLLRIKVGTQIKDTNIYIKGLPFNAKDIINNILIGNYQEPNQKRESNNTTEQVSGSNQMSVNASDVIKKDINGQRYILDLDILNNHYKMDSKNTIKSVLTKIGNKIGFVQDQIIGYKMIFVSKEANNSVEIPLYIPSVMIESVYQALW